VSGVWREAKHNDIVIMSILEEFEMGVGVMAIQNE
jgi:hypothetical protein